LFEEKQKLAACFADRQNNFYAELSSSVYQQDYGELRALLVMTRGAG
jgi:hypothetical protein